MLFTSLPEEVKFVLLKRSESIENGETPRSVLQLVDKSGEETNERAGTERQIKGSESVKEGDDAGERKGEIGLLLGAYVSEGKRLGCDQTWSQRCTKLVKTG